MRQACVTAVLVGLVAACSPSQKSADHEAVQGGKVAEAPTVAASTPAQTAQPSNARVSQYSNLKTCKTLDENPDEGWAEQLCPGLGGYKIRILAGDLREDAVVIPPAGKPEQSLDIPGVTGKGGFNHLGDVVEWRGAQASGVFKPVSLIMRFSVQENPDIQKDTSFLLAVRLDGAKPCITALIKPGPGQNERARQAADNPAACLKSYYDEHPAG